MSDESEIVSERRAKLKALREQGAAFPNDFRREHLAAALHERYDSYGREDLESQTIEVSVAGRMMLKRVMGKLSFATLRDMTGRIQLYVSDSDCGAETHEQFKSWDLGDIIGARGALFKTKTGELSVRARELRLLTKALRPLPEKFHGLADQEAKYRQRYLDLITNEETRAIFSTRTKMIQSLREFLVRDGYIEVETPMMHPIPGGAAAKPFVTHHNALDTDLYLRIAPELYLKRLVVGGIEKVFEINRSFRNEGISTRHNPEFTMLEFYVAYQDYRYLIDFIEAMLREVAIKVLGKTAITYQEEEIDLGRPFARLSIIEAIQKFSPEFTAEKISDRQLLVRALDQRQVAYQPNDGIGSLQLALFEATVEEHLVQPTFIIDYPAEVSPLARRSNKDPDIAERFELYIAGREIANGFSELNDPEDQAARFAEQARQKQAGNEEAMHYDADYIRALEHGLPPTAGAGIGIDRLAMLFTDSPSIRDVILFPQMRREE